MKAATALALGAGALLVGGALVVATKDEPATLPPPKRAKPCYTVADVNAAVIELTNDPTMNAAGYLAAADTLEHGTTYCDAASQQAGMMAAAYFRAKATNQMPPLAPFPFTSQTTFTSGAKTGACCASCARGDECEGCGNG